MSDSYKFNGTITVIKDEIQVTDKFKKRDVVVNDNGQYPQEVTFQFVQDKCDILDKYSEGDDVEVSFNLKGREWTDPKTGEVKYFNSVEGWRIESLVTNNDDKMTNEKSSETVATTDDDEDLPF